MMLNAPELAEAFEMDVHGRPRSPRRGAAHLLVTNSMVGGMRGPLAYTQAAELRTTLLWTLLC